MLGFVTDISGITNIAHKLLFSGEMFTGPLYEIPDALANSRQLVTGNESIHDRIVQPEQFLMLFIQVCDPNAFIIRPLQKITFHPCFL